MVMMVGSRTQQSGALFYMSYYETTIESGAILEVFFWSALMSDWEIVGETTILKRENPLKFKGLIYFLGGVDRIRTYYLKKQF